MVSGSGKKHLSSVFLIQHFFDIGLGLSWASLIAQLVKNPAVQETWAQFLGREDPLEKETATHSSILAWRIPWSLAGYSPWGCKSWTRPSDYTATTTRVELGLGLGVSQAALVEKNPPVNVGDVRRGFDPWDGKIPWGRAWQPTPIFLPGGSPSRESTAHRVAESDTAEVT